MFSLLMLASYGSHSSSVGVNCFADTLKPQCSTTKGSVFFLYALWRHSVYTTTVCGAKWHAGGESCIPITVYYMYCLHTLPYLSRVKFHYPPSSKIVIRSCNNIIYLIHMHPGPSPRFVHRSLIP